MLSLQVVKELDDLARKFDLGVKITVNLDDMIINIDGANSLDEEGRLHIVSDYEIQYGYNDKDELEIFESAVWQGISDAKGVVYAVG